MFVLSALAATSLPVKADAMHPSISVQLPFTVSAGDLRLAPGKYVIREISGMSNIFAVYRDNGMKFETYLMARPVEYTKPLEKTNVVLRSDGREYVMDEVRIEGQGVAYEFVTPSAVASREKERRISEVPAGKSGL